MAPILRLAALVISLYLMGDILQQFAKGSIVMSYGEFDDRIVITSLSGRILAMLMWTPFFVGLFLAGLKPDLYFRYRWLLPGLLIAIFFVFILFSITKPFVFQ